MIENSYDIYKEDFFEAIVVGGGTCGLAVAARLCEECPASIYTEDEHQRFQWLKQRGNKVNLVNRNISSKTKYKPSKNRYVLKKFSPLEILVLDSKSDSFLGQWDSQFAACQIPYLRSPMFFHPDPVNIDGLISYSYLTKRDNEKDLMKIENVVGKEYSKHQLKKQIAKKGKKTEHKDPVPITSSIQNHDKSGLIDINMRDWKDYYRPSTGLFKDFCNDIIERYRLHNVVKKDEVVSIEYCLINILDQDESGKGFIVKTASGKTFGCKICIVASGHRGEINYPIEPFKSNKCYPEGSCHSTHVFSGEVKFPTERIINKIICKKLSSIVIVGGGLTSAQLAHAAINNGVDKVYLIIRGSLKIKHFDFHLDWVTKYKNVKKSAFYIKNTDLERHEMIDEARQGGSVNPEYYKKLMKHINTGRLELLKHSIIDDKEWDEQRKMWSINIKTKKETMKVKDTLDPEGYFTTNLSNVDYIYFATGISANIESLSFLRPIIENHKIDTVKGLPCLTDNLQWNNDIPLFMLGKNASLRIGPSSANLDGARLGAERIGWYIQELKSEGNFQWHEKAFHNCCGGNSLENTSTLDEKFDSISSDSDSDLENNAPTSFETRLKLACGELNWFSLLDVT